MVKPHDSMKSLMIRASEMLRSLLEQVPAIKRVEIETELSTPDADIVAHIELAEGQHRALLCEVRPNGQPRHVRLGLLELRASVAHFGTDATPVFIAPYLSPEAQRLCREQAIGFLDLEGNARFVCDGIFIERLVASKPSVERRELKSLFRPKSAQVLRAMLRDPRKAWRVTGLADAADVSLGHVSNVRAGLLDREWGQVSDEGLFLSNPDALLDAWRDAYEPPTGRRTGFYTTLHGGALEEAARQVSRVDGGSGRVVFASFSAAHWMAPYGRTGTQYFYADEEGLKRLAVALKLSSTAKGENVVVTLLDDEGGFRDTIEAAPGAICTSPVQTYLDLTAAGERGREAADHLRRMKLTWLE
jgi:Transcriptional regulator, AbiEi antitoxin, Type IV TA system